MKGSKQVGDNLLGGWKSRVFSNLVTGGCSSEVMDRSDRQNLCLPETIERLQNFEIPSVEVFECYHRKYPSYESSNLPFYLYSRHS